MARRLTTAPGGTLQNVSYSYDVGGNVTRIADSVWTGSRTLAYDALNRLVAASGWQGGVSEQYSYDAVWDIARRASVLYTYSDSLHPWGVTGTADGRTFTYDLNGNATSDAGLQLVWNADNLLQTASGAGGTVSYTYDAQGARVTRTTPDGITRSPFTGYEVDPHGVIKKSLGLVARKSSGLVLFYHDDHLGSTNVITDGNGARVQLVEYSPWGQISRSEGSADPSYRFRTAEVAMGRPRLYDPALGRFISVEPVVPDLRDPQMHNVYSYGRNNPASLPVAARPGSSNEGL